MNFIISSSSLLKQLQSISGVIKSKNTLPILDNYLFDIKGNDLYISASDLETSIITKITINSEENGSISVPKEITDILKTFPDVPLNFNINFETNEIGISSDEGKYKLPGYPGDEYPKFPQLENSSNLLISSKNLYNAITKTLFAVSTDEMRPVMNGVYFYFTSEGAIFVATDAHKLVKYKRTDTKIEEGEVNFIVPPKPLNILKNLISSEDININVEYNEKNVMFSFGDTKIVSKLIEGRYPNYEAVIPYDNSKILIIDRISFLNSIKRIINFANKVTYQVRLTISGSEINISSEDLDASTTAKERLTCQYDGEDLEIGFNARFIVEMLSNINTENITIKFSEPNRAGIISPSDGDSEEEIIMLIMPVMV